MYRYRCILVKVKHIVCFCSFLVRNRYKNTRNLHSTASNHYQRINKISNSQSKNLKAEYNEHNGRLKAAEMLPSISSGKRDYDRRGGGPEATSESHPRGPVEIQLLERVTSDGTGSAEQRRKKLAWRKRGRKRFSTSVEVTIAITDNWSPLSRPG